jgi:hypothetical protein
MSYKVQGGWACLGMEVICASAVDRSGLRARTEVLARHLPDAALLFPAVERVTVDLVEGRLCDPHVARFSGKEKIDVVRFLIGTTHVGAGNVLTAAKIGHPVVMYFERIERDILALVFEMKFFVRRLFTRSINILLDSAGHIRRAYLLGRDLLLLLRWWLRPRHRLRRSSRRWHPASIPLGPDRSARGDD